MPYNGSIHNTEVAHLDVIANAMSSTHLEEHRVMNHREVSVKQPRRENSASTNDGWHLNKQSQYIVIMRKKY